MSPNHVWELMQCKYVYNNGRKVVQLHRESDNVSAAEITVSDGQLSCY